MRYVEAPKAAATLFAGFLALLAALFLMTNAGWADVLATGLSIKGDKQTTRVAVTISAPLGYSARVLPDPFRVVVDAAGLNFDLRPGEGRKKQGLVSNVRYGQVEEGKSRIVIATDGPVLIGSSFLKVPEDGAPPQIVIDLLPISEEVFNAVYAKDNPGAPPRAKPLAEPEAVSSIAPAPPAIKQLPAKKPVPKVEAPLPPRHVITKKSRPDGKKVIVIDAGHGGKDSGAVSPNGTLEKDVVLAFAQALKAAIDADGKHIAVLTREADVFVSLVNRVRFARAQGADLLIAIHADIVRGKTATGTTIYTLSEKASDAEAEALAQKENRADEIGTMDLGIDNEEVTEILIELVRRQSKNHAVAFSQSMLNELEGVTPMAGKPLRSAGFTVLKGPDVPSVLVELGFLSTKVDEERLLSAEWRAKTAAALTAAINRHFNELVAAKD